MKRFTEDEDDDHKKDRKKSFETPSVAWTLAVMVTNLVIPRTMNMMTGGMTNSSFPTTKTTVSIFCRPRRCQQLVGDMWPNQLLK